MRTWPSSLPGWRAPRPPTPRTFRPSPSPEARMERWIELNNRVLTGTSVDTRHDLDALQVYFQEKVNQNTVFFHTLREKVRYLVEHGVWDASVFDRYAWEDVQAVFDRAYSYRFRFQSFMGAYKFYSEYA